MGIVYVQGRAEGGTTLTAQAAGYNDGVVNVTVAPSGFEFSQSTLGTTTFAANSAITVRARRLDPGTRNVSGPAQEVRGGLTVQITLTSSATNVGTLTSPLTMSGGQSQANASFDPIAGWHDDVEPDAASRVQRAVQRPAADNGDGPGIAFPGWPGGSVLEGEHGEAGD